MRDNNHIVIPSFMRTRLGLKGVDLIIVALIYGFSQDGETEFRGSLSYISDWCGISKRHVLEHLQSLVEAQVLLKTDTLSCGVKRCGYRFNMSMVGAWQGGGDETSPGVVTKRHRGGDETSPNNIEYNIDIYRKRNIYKEKESLIAPPPPIAPPPSPAATTRGKAFVPPTVEEVRAYINGKGYVVDADLWWNFYAAKGWMIGKNRMKDWHAAIATWQRSERGRHHEDGNVGRERQDRRREADITASRAEDYEASF